MQNSCLKFTSIAIAPLFRIVRDEPFVNEGLHVGSVLHVPPLVEPTCTQFGPLCFQSVVLLSFQRSFGPVLPPVLPENIR